MANNKNTVLGTYLRERRGAMGLTQDQVVELSGVSKTYYRKLETGLANNPSLSIIAKLSAALGVDRWVIIRMLAKEVEEL